MGISLKNREEKTENGVLRFLRNTAVVSVILAVFGVIIGVVSLLVVARYKNISTMQMFVTYIHNSTILLLNLIPPVLIILLIYFISGRAWVSFLFTSTLFLGLSAAHYLKVVLRSDPLTASDLFLIGEAGNIMTRYTVEMNWRYIVIPLGIILGTVFCALVFKGAEKRWLVRIICSVLVLVIIIGVYVKVYRDDTLYNSTKNEEAYEIGMSIWSKEHKYISMGFAYPFLHSIKSVRQTPPEGYDEETAGNIVASYSYDDIEEGKKVNVISIMLEAFSDISRFEELEIDDSVYAPLYELMARSYSGTLVPNVNAAGTINTEHAFVTGSSQIATIKKNTNSYIRYFNEQGYQTGGFHAGDEWFYNRSNVNDFLGYESYDFLETVEGSDRTDNFFFTYLKSAFDARDTGKPYFSFNLTYQNHGPYWDGDCGVQYSNSAALSEKTKNIIANYLIGVENTIDNLVRFVDSFEDEEAPVIIVVFGDHMPWMGDSSSVLTEAGINIDTRTEEGFYNLYSTPYFIWANDSAKEITGCDFVGEGETMSPNFLMAKLFSLCSWGGNEMIKINQKLFETIPVLNTATGTAVENGEYTTSISDEGKKLVSEFEYAQYKIMTDKVN